jgi:hypothetical protein
MLTTFWTAPAGVCGRGSVAVRPSLLAAVPVVQGSGLPAAGMAPRNRDRVAVRTGFGAALIQKTTPNDAITQNDGTTLGIHPSRRPRS